MWTPRRILLLLVGLAGFTVAYLGYARVLGGVDGLPELPPKFAEREVDNGSNLPPAIESPTIVRLREAFGGTSNEVTDFVSYKTKLELRDKGIVIACGQPQFSPEPSQFVTVAPFSFASFGKPRPAHLRQPNEVPEITTLHADKAVLEFDRPVTSAQDLNGKAKMVGMELVSTPDVPAADPRKGRIWLTSNQRTTDANQHLIFRTPGPLFYRPAEAGAKTPVDAPQIWSTAAVEVIDRRNLPRPLRFHARQNEAVQSRADDLRGRNAVANILLGLTLPPPTVTAEGMKIYLQPQEANAPADKRNATGYSGVRRIDLCEKVQMNLWSDGGSGGFPGTSSGPVKPVAVDPPPAAGGLLGGFADAAAVARLLESKTLMVVETLGPFRYDLQKNLAHFDAATTANPAVPNHVTVSRLSARGGQDNLFCTQLVVQFADPNAPQPAGKPQPAASPAEGLKIRSLTATGKHVFVSVEGEQLLAQGTELRYEVDAAARKTTTLLRGTPVVAVRDRNRLQGGDANTPAEVVIVATEPAPNSKDKKKSDVAVRGPGRMELFDQAANDNTLQASWGQSLTQERQSIGGRDQDLLKFEGGSAFADIKGGMKLSANSLWLWLGAPEGSPVKSATPTNAVPQRVVATGNVEGTSADLLIRDTDQFTIWFRDVPPPPEPVVVKPAVPAVAPQPAAPVEVAKKEPEKAPEKKPAEKPKPPMHLSARVIESWVARFPQPKVAAKPPAGAAPAQPALKYEMERARCEDRVKVHQDPSDPAKSARGVDIAGTKLNVEGSRAGNVLTVHGGPTEWAQVHFEDLSLFGPVVVIDQPSNAVSVDGRGALRMPAGSDLAGNAAPAGKPLDLDIQWATEMRFFGAKATAEFVGAVHAVQQPRNEVPQGRVAVNLAARARTPAEALLASRPQPQQNPNRAQLLCHRLDVTFDRPVYFNQYRRDTANTKQTGDKAKLRTARCTPMADDDYARLPGQKTPNTVVFWEEAFGPDGKYTKAQRISAKQLDMHLEDREQTMYATGPGEVRILQLGAKDGPAQGPIPQPQPPRGTAAKPAEQEMKLTVVWFQSRMVTQDKAKEFQQATFDDGARVIQLPSDNIAQTVAPHLLPREGGVYLSCTDKLTVSTTKLKNAPAKQEMTALGNAKFITDEYEGDAAKITYDGSATIFEGNRERQSFAHLYRRRVGVNNRESHTAERIIYSKDGTVNTTGSAGGAINTGP